MRKVLLLNQNGEALNLIHWTKAMTLLFKGKVYACEYFEDLEVKSQTEAHKVPSVIALVRYVVLPSGRQVSLTKANLLIRDQYSCQYCKCDLTTHKATVDHVVPSSRGGQRVWKNVVAACKPCNEKKSDKTPQEAGMALRRRPWVPSRKVVLKQRAAGLEYGKSWAPYFA